MFFFGSKLTGDKKKNDNNLYTESNPDQVDRVSNTKLLKYFSDTFCEYGNSTRVKELLSLYKFNRLSKQTRGSNDGILYTLIFEIVFNRIKWTIVSERTILIKTNHSFHEGVTEKVTVYYVT